MPAIRACLEHRHSYVRRNAVLAIYTIYRYKLYSSMSICHTTYPFLCLHDVCISINNELMEFICHRNFEHLIPDAPELIHDFLVNEKDASCKRNAFMMLIHADQVRSPVSLLKCFHRYSVISKTLIIFILMPYRIELWIISAPASTKSTLLETFCSWSLWS